MTIWYDGWKFKEPPLFTRGEFLTYKQLLLLYPEKRIEPDTDKVFWESCKVSVIIVCLGIAGAIMCSYAEDSLNRDTVLFSLLEYGWAILFVIGFLTFWPLILTIVSYLRFSEQKREWYEKIEGVINNSDDYAEFLSNYKAVFISNHQLKNYDRS